MAPFDIDIQYVDGAPRLSVFGELDLAHAPELAARLEDVAAAGRRPIEVDLSGITFIDARGLRVLIAAHDRYADEGGLRLVRASGPARRLFELTGMSRLLAVDDRTD